MTELLLPVGSHGRNSLGWWGLLCLIATEASLFAYLLFSYLYVAVQHPHGWSPDPHPSISLSGPNTLVLLASSAAAWWGELGVKRAKTQQAVLGLGGAVVLGLIFLGVQVIEWKAKPYTLSSGAYGSLFFTITGFHMAHVAAGVLMLGLALLWSALGRYGPRHAEPVSLIAAYWHFVDGVWVVVFTTFYLAPYIGVGG